MIFSLDFALPWPSSNANRPAAMAGNGGPTFAKNSWPLPKATRQPRRSLRDLPAQNPLLGPILRPPDRKKAPAKDGVLPGQCLAPFTGGNLHGASGAGSLACVAAHPGLNLLPEKSNSRLRLPARKPARCFLTSNLEPLALLSVA
jgi:hypothetical protein